MADFYALPTLTKMRSTSSTTTANQAYRTGWSNTSGGPNIAPTAPLPSSGDRVFFDSNSGPSREIIVDNGFYCAYMTTESSAPMTFTGTGPIQVYSYEGIGSGINLTGTVRVDPTIYIQPYTYTVAQTVSITAPDVFISRLQIQWNANIKSDLNVGALAVVSPTDAEGNMLGFNVVFSNTNVSANSLSWESCAASIYMGKGTFTVRGGYALLMYTAAASVYSQGCTVCLDLDSIPSSGFYFNPRVSGDYNLWIKRTPGVLNIPSTTYSPKLDWRIDPGCSITLASGGYSAKNYNWRGNPSNRISVSTTSGSSTLAIAAGGPERITFDFCNLTRVNGSPANTFYGRACTLVTSNIIPYFAAPGFAAFF